jgi:cell division protein FtsQ
VSIAVALVVLLGGAWLWLRDSSLVSVDRVSVSGESGPDSVQIRSALVAAARNMTTLDVRMDELRMAVAPYPVVKDLRVSTQFPHGIRIRVIEQIPVGVVVVAGRTIAVAGDGTLLHDVVPSSTLPTIPLGVPPGGSRLSEPGALHAVALLAAAPYQLLAHISQVTTVSSHGLVAQLRNGPSIYFGDATRLAVKWVAASAVLADAGSTGAVYIDVTDPERPAAGAGSTGAASTGAASTGTSGVSAGATTSSPAPASSGSTASTPTGG